MIKLITCDLDGTLLDTKKFISDFNKSWINKCQNDNIRFIVATGRPYNGIGFVIDRLNLENEYIICYNGAQIINNKTKEVEKGFYITGKEVKDLYHESNRLDINFHAFTLDGKLVAKRHNFATDIEAKINNLEIHIIDFDEVLDTDLFIKAMFIDHKEHIDNIYNDINKLFFDRHSVLRSTDIYLEFVAKDVNKGSALVYLANKLNIDLAETMAIGDANNDLAMIRVCPNSVAMKNGFDEILKEAKYITDTNDLDGVGKAIQKIVYNM